MKLFDCDNCGQVVFFENTHCESCGRALGFLPETASLGALAPGGSGVWRPAFAPERLFRYCANATFGACNWLVPTGSAEEFCRVCRLNRTIPNLDKPENLERWRKLEIAKHRLGYSLLRLGLPMASKRDDPETGLAFDFLADESSTNDQAEPVMTGHVGGLVTIDLAESHDPTRERRREDLAETYRTLLGHLRHEVGHYYWERLVADTERLEPFRRLFGDERKDYGASLQAYYAEGPPRDWPERFVSAYASAHPWEDWAETWAHLLHILDTLETAYAFGISLQPRAGCDPKLAAAMDSDPFDQDDFGALLQSWLPLTYAINSLNRSMGQPDLYPFVLAPEPMEKLHFVHRLVRHGSG